jgi:UDPglucose 6-dehydrogenase
MKILICGYGFVGKAHAFALSFGNNEVHIYDPAYDIYKERLTNPDAVIITVSTPAHENGKCNINNVYDSIVNVEDDDVPILIKSTISLEGWRFLLQEFPNKKISFSPEYLRAAHAYEDFKKQEVVYIGGGDNIFWASIFSLCLGVKIQCADPEELILAKYMRNSFLALKVAFFNQVYDLCKATDIDFNRVRQLATEDPRIGKSHSYINLERGFGGHCFPKDTSAISHTAKQFDSPMTVIDSAILYNNELRKEK